MKNLIKVVSVALVFFVMQVPINLNAQSNTDPKKVPPPPSKKSVAKKGNATAPAKLPAKPAGNLPAAAVPNPNGPPPPVPPRQGAVPGYDRVPSRVNPNGPPPPVPPRQGASPGYDRVPSRVNPNGPPPPVPPRQGVAANNQIASQNQYGRVTQSNNGYENINAPLNGNRGNMNRPNPNAQYQTLPISQAPAIPKPLFFSRDVNPVPAPGTQKAGQYQSLPSNAQTANANPRYENINAPLNGSQGNVNRANPNAQYQTIPLKPQYQTIPLKPQYQTLTLAPAPTGQSAQYVLPPPAQTLPNGQNKSTYIKPPPPTAQYGPGPPPPSAQYVLPPPAQSLPNGQNKSAYDKFPMPTSTNGPSARALPNAHNTSTYTKFPVQTSQYGPGPPPPSAQYGPGPPPRVPQSANSSAQAAAPKQQWKKATPTKPGPKSGPAAGAQRAKPDPRKAAAAKKAKAKPKPKGPKGPRG